MKENWSFFRIIILISLGIVTLLSVSLSVKSINIFILNENQLLYLFSAMAQVIGSVFGLTLTAYVFFVEKFKDSAKDDDTYYDAMTTLLSHYFYSLILIAVICGLTIFLCVVGIVALHKRLVSYSFIINESVLFFLIGIVAILVFGIMLFDPKKLEKELTKLKKKADEFYSSLSSDETGDFIDFLRTYNLLEQVIIDFANICVKNAGGYYYGYKPQIIQSLKLLYREEIISGTLQNEINELRMYRNGLVHGLDFTISKNVCEHIKEIYNALRNAYDICKKGERNSKEWEEAIAKLYDLSRTI